MPELMGRAWAATLAAGLLAAPAAAEITLPPGFTSATYVTGSGFDRGGQGGTRGIPVVMTLGFDGDGVLYLARSGNRYGQSQPDTALSRVYRIPPGGARLTPDAEVRYAYGPPLLNPEVGAAGGRGELWVTTSDPERGVGALYRLRDGRAELLAGGTPPAGSPPLFKQPEGVALDAAGNLYVADRARGLVVKLDPAGRVLDPHYAGLRVARARMLAMSPADQLWIAGDGAAEQPWQEGAGQIWRVGPDGRRHLIFEGPHAAGIAVGRGGVLFVAQRQAGRILALTGEGVPIEFARFTGEQPRTLAFAPDGDLFVVSLAPQTWYLNEVIRISGPFAELARKARATP